jgi:uncharacterized membrane protein (UPF0127 family)
MSARPALPRKGVVSVLGPDGRILCERCRAAGRGRPFARMRGLLGRRLAPGEGLLLWPASSIHTFFMRYAIDVVFVDRDLNVVEIAAGVQPWRAASRRGARAVLELAAGECDRHGLASGDRIGFADAPG